MEIHFLMNPDVGRILAAIETWKATMFFAPPTVWIGMFRHPDFGRYDLSRLVKCYYGASIMPMENLREILEKFPRAGVQLLRPDRAGAVSLHPQGRGRPGEDTLNTRRVSRSMRRNAAWPREARSPVD